MSSIPSTYRDLVIVCDVTTNNVNTTQVQMVFNSSNTTTYFAFIRGNASTAAANNGNATVIYLNQDVGCGPTSAKNNLSIAHILDYAQTNKGKPILVRSNRIDEFVENSTSFWDNVNAINQIAFTTANGFSFAPGSIFHLFGIAG